MNDRPATEAESGMGLSRRSFFTGAGMAAGAVAALGGIAGSAISPAAQAAVASRRYFSNQVALELDGVFAGPVIAAEGGDPVLMPGIRNTDGPSTVAYEPLSMAIGDMTVPVFDWIGKSSGSASSSHAGAVIAYGADLKEIYRLSFQGGRIVETATDPLDATSSDPLRLHVKIAPTQANHKVGGRSSYDSTTKLRANPMLRSNFRLYVQGLVDSAPHVRSIERVGFTVGPNGSVAPLPLKFTVAFREAAPIIKWMDETLAGVPSTRAAELQLLSRDSTRVVASVTFTNLFLKRVGCPLESSSERIQSLEVECLPATIKFNMGELVA